MNAPTPAASATPTNIDTAGINATSHVIAVARRSPDSQ